MPRELAMVHDRFWNQFKETGIAKILESERIVFVKDKNGQVHPFEIFIKFMYHQFYGYIFVGIFKKLNQMLMNEEEVITKLNKVFFFVTNHQFKITEIS